MHIFTKNIRIKALLCPVVIALCILVTSAACVQRTQAASTVKRMVIYAIDLGANNDGEATMVVDGSGGSLLIDTGAYYNNNDKKLLFVWLRDNNYRKKKFDLLITHWHNDHVANTLRLIKDYNIGTIYYPEPVNVDRHYINLFDEIKNAAGKRKIKLVKLETGQKIRVGKNVSGEVLYVNGKCDYSSDKNQRENNQSAAVKFTCGKRTFLTCGDAERQEDKALFQLGDKIKADIFKMSHHGYYQAEGGDYTWKFIKKVNPAYSWFTTYDATPKNFRPESVTRLVRKIDSISNVFSTRYNGTIRFDCTDKGITVSADRNTCTMTRVLTHINSGKKRTVRFVFNRESIPTLTKLLINSSTYTSLQVNSRGRTFFGTMQEGSPYLRAKNGLYAVNTQAKAGNTYYWFNEDGKILDRGWARVNGNKYFFQPERATGLVETDKGKFYYFMDRKCPGYTPAKEGRIYEGFLKLRDENNKVIKYYFMGKDHSHYATATGMEGRRVTGWNTIDYKKYYMKENGVIVTGLKEIGGYKYYFDGEGVMQTGLRTINGYKYYFDEKHGGRMLTAGAKWTHGNLYYFGSTGRAYTNRYGVVGGVKYWFDKNGMSSRAK